MAIKIDSRGVELVRTLWVQTKTLGEDIGIYHRHQGQECRHVLTVQLELGNRKLSRIPISFLSSLFYFSPMCFLYSSLLTNVFCHAVYVTKMVLPLFLCLLHLKDQASLGSQSLVHIPRRDVAARAAPLGLLDQSWACPGEGASSLSRHCKCRLG